MERQLINLANQVFDVMVIGGGIHGAVAAWDAALRGLSVALIDRGDFGCATSQNSLKIIHGGLRYLQDGNLARIRKMACERTTWMKIAPHLVHPLPCLTPTHKNLSRSRPAMYAALALNDLLSFDRNRLPDTEKHLPGGNVISAQECAGLLPGYDASGITGAALWHDAQIYNTERLLLEFIRSAADAGAVVANYVEAVDFIRKEMRVSGVKAIDRITGQAIDIQSRVVINAAGAWVNNLLGQVAAQTESTVSIAMNLIVDKIWAGAAAALPSHPKNGRRSQILMIVPWHNNSLIGTWHVPWNQSPDAFRLNPAIIQEFVDEINSAHPRLSLTIADLRHINWGFLPVHRKDAGNSRVRLMRDDLVIDHQIRDGISGLISVVSVKYTTARVTAKRALDLAAARLSARPANSCKTGEVPVTGGRIDDFKAFINFAQAETAKRVDPAIIEHLVFSYGANYKKILQYFDQNNFWSEPVAPGLPVTAAEVVHAVRHEMAQTLSDVIQRRTEIGAACQPSLPVLQKCVEIAGCELGWSAEKQRSEIQAVLQAYPLYQMENKTV